MGRGKSREKIERSTAGLILAIFAISEGHG